MVRSPPHRPRSDKEASLAVPKKSFLVPTLTCVGGKLLLGDTPIGEAIYSSAGFMAPAASINPGAVHMVGGAQGSSSGRAHQP